MKKCACACVCACGREVGRVCWYGLTLLCLVERTEPGWGMKGVESVQIMCECSFRSHQCGSSPQCEPSRWNTWPPPKMCVFPLLEMREGWTCLFLVSQLGYEAAPVVSCFQSNPIICHDDGKSIQHYNYQKSQCSYDAARGLDSVWGVYWHRCCVVMLVCYSPRVVCFSSIFCFLPQRDF